MTCFMDSYCGFECVDLSLKENPLEVKGLATTSFEFHWNTEDEDSPKLNKFEYY